MMSSIDRERVNYVPMGGLAVLQEVTAWMTVMNVRNFYHPHPKNLEGTVFRGVSVHRREGGYSKRNLFKSGHISGNFLLL